MHDPLDFENRPLMERLERRRKIAWCVLCLENVTLHGWRAFFWGLLFCGLWLFQIPAVFGQVGSVLALAAFTAGLFYFFLTDIRRFRFPSRKETDRRLEQASGLMHRPLSGLDDRLANPAAPETRTLWQQSKGAVIKMIAHVTIPGFRAFMAEKDPRAIRLGIFIFFLAGLAVAGPDWNDRLRHGLMPLSLVPAQKSAASIHLWITPPDYTGLAQMVVEGAGSADKILEIPEGSTIKIRMNAKFFAPALRIGRQSRELEALGEDNYGLELTTKDMPPAPENKKDTPGTLTITQMGISRLHWPFRIVPDEPPQITETGEHEVLPHGQIRFPFTVRDDYGVRDIAMTMTLDEMIEDRPLGLPVTETRSVMSPASADFEIQPVYDLTYHPWAGLPVVFTFEVSDHQNQNAAARPVAMTLPERIFTHPVAKKLVALRKKLAWEPTTAAAETSAALDEILAYPEAFQSDTVVFLALRSAASRLRYALEFPHNTPEDTALPVMALLWDTALRVEDGNLTLAARNLRDSQMALENALQNPETSKEEIGRLMDELRSAMAEYLMELQKDLQKRMAEGENMPMISPDMLSSVLDPESLAEFLDQMESEMLSGDRKAAQEMLSQLQRMMDMMDPSMAGPMPPDMQMMMEGISELQQLIDRQKDLVGQTKQQAESLKFMQDPARGYGETLEGGKERLESWGLENMPPPPGTGAQDGSAPAPPPIVTKENRAEQEALRYILGQLMMDAAEEIGEIPDSMGLAEQEMRGSSAELGENDPAASIPHQEKAVEYLQQAQEDLSKQLQTRLQQMMGMALSEGMRYDPLGRPYGADGDRPGMFPGSRVKIPDEAERKRVEEILKLLRRRSGELNRPDEELEYFRRLLRQF